MGRKAKNSLQSIITSNAQPLEIIQRLIDSGYEVISQTPVPVSVERLKGGAENEWADSQHVAYIQDYFQSPVMFWGYEWVSFHLPGGSYTPDFMYVLQTGRIVFLEIKGSKRQANYRDARSKLRGAATLNPWFMFCECRIDKNSWVLERIKPDGTWIGQYT